MSSSDPVSQAGGRGSVNQVLNMGPIIENMLFVKTLNI